MKFLHQFQSKTLRQATAWVSTAALILSVVVPGGVTFADHDPFGGYVFQANEKLEGHGAPHVGICHSLTGDNFQHLNIPVSSIMTGGNAHGTNHLDWDIVPPFHYDLGEGEQSYAGNKWTEENISFLINGCQSVVADPTYSISGMKFSDDNQDGAKDDGEAGLEGWTIYLDMNHDGVLNDGDVSTISDADGNYIFEGLTDNTDYYVREQNQAGWTQTYPGAG